MSAPKPVPDTAERTRLQPEQLRWVCDPDSLHFTTTDDVEPITHVVGQEQALRALRFGLQVDAPGQNVYVRGLAGSGRLTLLRNMLEETRLTCPLPPDRCAVRNFLEPDRPRLIVMPFGTARKFRLAIEDFVRFMVDDLGPALSGEQFRERREAMESSFAKQLHALVGPFEEKLEALQLSLVTITAGSMQRPALVPRIDGQPVMREAFEAMVAEGKVTETDRQQFVDLIEDTRPEMETISVEVERLQNEHQNAMQQFVQSEARALLAGRAARILNEFDYDVTRQYLDGMIEDYIEHRLGREGFGAKELRQLYEVNVIVAHPAGTSCPVVAETAPTLQNLLGGIEPELSQEGSLRADHTRIRAGSLLRASGGFLLLEARDLLEEPGAWRVLMRTLRTGTVEMVPPEVAGNAPLPIKPEAAPVSLKVVLIGDTGMYYALDELDEDFATQFKVLADFEPTIPIREGAVALYAGVLSHIVRKRELHPIDRSGIAMLAEYGARIAGRNDELTARFGRVLDVLHEAAYLVGRAGGSVIDATAVEDAVTEMRLRAGSASRRFRAAIREGTLRIETRGSTVGQVNGLAVIHAGPLTYGFPSRITATVGPGETGAVNIEEEAKLSGSIHTKGFYILGGLMRHLLRTPHPLSFSASITFEQSYGGIDGDSASGAEMCSLISALTGIPARQDLAMTGAIDQHGAIQAIGAVAEKIEGFYDACVELGLTGTQGVIIPTANLKDLMLHREVVQACRDGQFHVYAVDRIEDALELFTGVQCGRDNEFAEDSLLGIAMRRLREYWEAGIRRL